MFFLNKVRRTAQLSLGLFLVSWHLHTHAATADFIEFTIESPYTLIAAPLAADIIEGNGKEILIFAVDEKYNRYLLIYQFDEILNDFKSVDQVAIAQKYHSYDISEHQAGSTQSLLFLASHELAQYQAATEKKPGSIDFALSLSTLILKENADFLAHSHFIKDINKDSYPDLIVANFESTQILLGSDKGYTLQALPIKADVIVDNRGATYASPKLYLADINQDQRLDIIKIETGFLLAYLQRQDHSFFEQPTRFRLDENINGTDWWYQRDSNGEELDQSNLTYRKVDEFKDINNDSIPDMVVRLTQSSGVLDRSNDYEIYLGELLDGQYALPLKPSSIIQADGTLSGFELVDIDGDEKFEVKLSGFDIGLTQIIGALVSGSINQDVYIFAQDQNSHFGDTPIAKENVSLKFSLRSGRSGSAVVELADTNGDGYKELLLSKNNKGLSIFTGNAEQLGFNKKAVRYKTQLPEDNSNIAVADINLDNKDDLIFHFGKLDDEKSVKTVKILFGK